VVVKPRRRGKGGSVKDFLILQVAVTAFVAIIVMNEESLNAALIGGASSIPKWVNLINPKVKFV
jgi:hypothetical protein